MVEGVGKLISEPVNHHRAQIDWLCLGVGQDTREGYSRAISATGSFYEHNSLWFKNMHISICVKEIWMFPVPREMTQIVISEVLDTLV